MLALLIIAPAAHAGAPVITFAWAPPYQYAVLWWGDAPADACVTIGADTYGCGSTGIAFLLPERTDQYHAEPGQVAVLTSPTYGEVARATLGGRVLLPEVVRP